MYNICSKEQYTMAKLEENKNKLLQNRISENDYNTLKAVAYTFGTTPSKWVRQMIQMSINSWISAREYVETNYKTDNALEEHKNAD